MRIIFLGNSISENIPGTVLVLPSSSAQGSKLCYLVPYRVTHLPILPWGMKDEQSMHLYASGVLNPYTRSKPDIFLQARIPDTSCFLLSSSANRYTRKNTLVSNCVIYYSPLACPKLGEEESSMTL